MIAILVLGSYAWPLGARRFWRVAVGTIIIAVGYTIYSEWRNISVRRGWAYSDLMPTLPWIGTGVSPLLQWVLIPGIGFAVARRAAIRTANTNVR